MTDAHAFIPHIDARVTMEFRDILEQIAVTDDPNILAEFYEKLEELKEGHMELIHSIVRHVNDLKALASGTEFEIQRLATLRDERLIRAERLEDTVARLMGYVGQTAIMFDDVTVGTYLTPNKVEVEDEEAIPPQYKNKKVTIEYNPDKNAIRNAIEAGIHIPGCKLSRTLKLRIK